MLSSDPMVFSAFRSYEEYTVCPKKVECSLLSPATHSTFCLSRQGVIIHRTIHHYHTVLQDNSEGMMSLDQQLISAHNYYDKCFADPRTHKGEKINIFFGSKNPRDVLQEGRDMIEMILRDPGFRGINVHFSEKTINLHLIRDPRNETFIPSLHSTKDSVNVRCRIDGIAVDRTILDFSICSKKSVEKNIFHQIKYNFYDLAINQENGLPTNQINHFKCMYIIRSRHPSLQVMDFTKTSDDRVHFLKTLYQIQRGIDSKIYFRSPNADCYLCQYRQTCTSSIHQNRIN
jgi:hypothetical protein